MYIIESDGYVVHSAIYADPDYIATSATLTQEFNRAGSLNFVVPENNAAHKGGRIKKHLSIIRVYQVMGTKKVEIWKGRPISVTVNFYKQATYECEGWLATLNDICAYPFEQDEGDVQASDSDIVKYPKDMIADLISQYKSRLSVNIVGTETYKWTDPLYSTDSSKNERIVECNFDYTGNSSLDYPTQHFPNPNFEGILDYIQTNILQNESIGGRIWVDGTTLYVRSLKPDTIERCTQPIVFGENMLNVSVKEDSADVYTAIHAIAPDVTDQDKWVTIQYDTDAIAKYGFVMRHTSIEGVFNKRSDFTDKAKEMLKNDMEVATEIEVNALDLSLLYPDLEPIKVGKFVPIISKQHGIEAMYLCTSANINLCTPSNSSYTFGTRPETLTSKQARLLKVELAASNYYQRL